MRAHYWLKSRLSKNDLSSRSITSSSYDVMDMLGDWMSTRYGRSVEKCLILALQAGPEICCKAEFINIYKRYRLIKQRDWLDYIVTGM
jgi:hypothetical protein